MMSRMRSSFCWCLGKVFFWLLSFGKLIENPLGIGGQLRSLKSECAHSSISLLADYTARDEAWRKSKNSGLEEAQHPTMAGACECLGLVVVWRMNKILNPISIMCHVLRLLSPNVIIAHKMNLTIMEAIEFEGDTHYRPRQHSAHKFACNFLCLKYNVRSFVCPDSRTNASKYSTYTRTILLFIGCDSIFLIWGDTVPIRFRWFQFQIAFFDSCFPLSSPDTIGCCGARRGVAVCIEGTVFAGNFDIKVAYGERKRMRQRPQNNRRMRWNEW